MGLGLVVVLALGAVSAAAPASTVADPTNPKIYDKTIGEWEAEWWNMIAAYPASETPVLQTGQVDCSFGQPSNKLWFLVGWLGSGDPVVRECTIPKDKAVMLPIVNAIGADFPPFDEDAYRDALLQVLEPIQELVCEVDGVPCAFHHLQVRTQSPVFSLDVPPGSVFTELGNEAGVYQALSDGYWVLLSPLGEGDHVIHFSAKKGGPVPFKLDVTYYITVE